MFCWLPISLVGARGFNKFATGVLAPLCKGGSAECNGAVGDILLSKDLRRQKVCAFDRIPPSFCFAKIHPPLGKGGKKCCNRFVQPRGRMWASAPTGSNQVCRGRVSLRLGPPAALTVPRTVIHYRGMPLRYPHRPVQRSRASRGGSFFILHSSSFILHYTKKNPRSTCVERGFES